MNYGLTESEHGIFNAILRGHIDFQGNPWPSISIGAKDLVKKMLNSDPRQRLTALQVLSKSIFFKGEDVTFTCLLSNTFIETWMTSALHYKRWCS